MITKGYGVDKRERFKEHSECGTRNAECGIIRNSEFGIRSSEFCPVNSAIRIPQWSGNSGMTLIEIIVVMVIIGILSATVIPRFDFTASFRASVEGAAYMIASDIRYAQEFAMANRVSKSVVFTSGAAVHTFNPTHTLDSSGQLPSGVTISNNFTITFNSLGEPTTGGGGSVTISGGGQTRTIGVVNYTGKVNIT